MPKILTVEYSERVLYYVNETRGATLPNLWSNPVFRLLIAEAYGVNCDAVGKPDALFSAGSAADDNDGFTSNLMRFSVQLCDECYEYVESLIENLLWDEIGEEFPNLAVSLKDEARAMMMAARDKITEVIESYIAAEESILYTQNHDYMAQIRERSAILKRQLTAQLSVEKAKAQQEKAPAGDESGGSPETTNETLSGVPTSIFAGIGRAGLPDPAASQSVYEYLFGSVEEQELREAAWDLQLSVHCYLTVVAKRLCDTVPMLVRHELVNRIPDKFIEYMSSKYDDDRLTKTMGADPAFVGRRAAKERVYSRMQHCLEHLNEAEIGGKAPES